MFLEWWQLIHWRWFSWCKRKACFKKQYRQLESMPFYSWYSILCFFLILFFIFLHYEILIIHIWVDSGNECCERLAYYGISTNLVSYLTKKLHEGNAEAARNVTTWQGTCYLTPLIGAVLADAYWGRYWTIAVFSTIYFIVITSSF